MLRNRTASRLSACNLNAFSQPCKINVIQTWRHKCLEDKGNTIKEKILDDKEKSKKINPMEIQQQFKESK